MPIQNGTFTHLRYYNTNFMKIKVIFISFFIFEKNCEKSTNAVFGSAAAVFIKSCLNIHKKLAVAFCLAIAFPCFA